MELIERNPPKIDIEKGWSPYISKDFLIKNGIETNNYKKCYDDEWQATSPYIQLNNEIIANNIAYYVSGNNSIAKQLKLVLNVNSQIGEDLAIQKFIECTHSLYKAALNKTLPEVLNKSILKRKDKVLSFVNKKVSIHKSEHQNKLKGYTFSFTIRQE
ncbi:hypothetical protein GCM10028805_41220 [Spirosoma harenae]